MLVKDIVPAVTVPGRLILPMLMAFCSLPLLMLPLADELWKSDGTTAGTVLVKDINAG